MSGHTELSGLEEIIYSLCLNSEPVGAVAPSGLIGEHRLTQRIRQIDTWCYVLYKKKLKCCRFESKDGGNRESKLNIVIVGLFSGRPLFSKGWVTCLHG